MVVSLINSIVTDSVPPAAEKGKHGESRGGCLSIFAGIHTMLLLTQRGAVWSHDHIMISLTKGGVHHVRVE